MGSPEIHFVRDCVWELEMWLESVTPKAFGVRTFFAKWDKSSETVNNDIANEVLDEVSNLGDEGKGFEVSDAYVKESIEVENILVEDVVVETINESVEVENKVSNDDKVSDDMKVTTSKSVNLEFLVMEVDGFVSDKNIRKRKEKSHEWCGKCGVAGLGHIYNGHIRGKNVYKRNFVLVNRVGKNVALWDKVDQERALDDFNDVKKQVLGLGNSMIAIAKESTEMEECVTRLVLEVASAYKDVVRYEVRKRIKENEFIPVKVPDQCTPTHLNLLQDMEHGEIRGEEDEMYHLGKRIRKRFEGLFTYEYHPHNDHMNLINEFGNQELLVFGFLHGGIYGGLGTASFLREFFPDVS
nr:hypothetical protein [Tanacetum cinerariifolium]